MKVTTRDTDAAIVAMEYASWPENIVGHVAEAIAAARAEARREALEECSESIVAMHPVENMQEAVLARIRALADKEDR